MKTLVFSIVWALGFSFTDHAAATFDDGKKDGANSQKQPICFCHKPDPWANDPDYAEALRHAPILWFANEEQYFPTLPFFSAFDSVDNDGDHALDFADRDEIAPFDSASRDFSTAAWDKLKAWYDSLAVSDKRKMTAVFYRKRTTTANEVKDILFNDEQYWRRFEKKLKADPAFKKYFDSKNTIAVYEYFFYYVNDEGLQGHPNDGARLHFCSSGCAHPVSHHCRRRTWRRHASNVLVYNMNGEPDLPANYEYKDHLHILVELGGHSLAPDLKGDGRFDPVVDANWHSENPWGTRDVQAKVGGGATGKYAMWMTFKRDPLKKVFPPDPDLQLAAPHYCYRLLPAEKFEDFYGLLATDSLAAAFINKTPYKSSDLSDFAREIGYKKDRSKRDKSLESYIEDEFNFLNEVARGYNGSNTIGTLSIYQSAPPLKFWANDLIKDLSGSGIPLHRPQSFALSTQAERHVYPMLQFAWLVDPQISRGVLELQAGTVISKIDRQYPEFSALYDLSYENTFSFFGKISWRHARPATSDVTVGLGLSFVPPIYILEIRPHDFFRHFRLRAGIRMGLKDNKKSTNLALAPEVQIGWWYRLPIAFPNQYKKISSRKHQVWEHASYKGDPIDIFKPHLFRPRSWKKVGIGVWGRTELTKKAKPEPRLSVIVPAWDFIPVKLDGILEIQAWWKDPRFKKLSPRKFINEFERQRWTLAVYYDRFYAAKLSWYANIAWINNLTEEARYSAGGGVSITLGPLFGMPLVRDLHLQHWLKMRFGFRSDFDRKTSHLIQHRLELQLGLHY
jgi:hypothetical protein